MVHKQLCQQTCKIVVVFVVVVFFPFSFMTVFFRAIFDWHTGSDYAIVFRDFLLNSLNFRVLVHVNDWYLGQIISKLAQQQTDSCCFTVVFVSMQTDSSHIVRCWHHIQLSGNSQNSFGALERGGQPRRSKAF